MIQDSETQTARHRATGARPPVQRDRTRRIAFHSRAGLVLASEPGATLRDAGLARLIEQDRSARLVLKHLFPKQKPVPEVVAG
jgi:hypothetical protein